MYVFVYVCVCVCVVCVFVCVHVYVVACTSVFQYCINNFYVIRLGYVMFLISPPRVQVSTT